MPLGTLERLRAAAPKLGAGLAYLVRRLGGAVYRAGSLVLACESLVQGGAGRLRGLGDGSRRLGERLQAAAQVLRGTAVSRADQATGSMPPREPIRTGRPADLASLAQSYLDAARTRNAVESLTRHLAIAPHDAHAFLALHRLHVGLGEPEEAMRVLRRAAGTDSDRLTIQGALGDFLYRVYRVGTVLRDHAAACGDGERNFRSELFTGDLDIETARKDMAIALDAALDHPVSPSRRVERALVLLRRALDHAASGDSRSAAAVCEDITRMGSSLPWAHYLRGRIAEAAGDRATAFRCYAAAVESHPVFNKAQARLGHLYCDSGDALRAAEHFNARLEGGSIAVETR